MGEGVLTFASEMVRAFGEDRFFHALMRMGTSREGRLINEAMGGGDWSRKSMELGLRSGRPDFSPLPMDDLEANEVLCRTAYVLSAHHKEFALRTPSMPPSIHARMVLGEQNEWTRRYAKGLEAD